MAATSIRLTVEADDALRFRTDVQLFIADLTSANPNVYLEVGYAWGKEVPTVLIVKRTADLKFDVRGQRCIVYSTIKELESKLTTELQNIGTAA